MAVNQGASPAPSYTLVAIPSQEDYIWRLSSEKVPHLTLLFLGDKLENLSKVRDVVQHVVDTTLCKFWLDVDQRGVLGDKEADVLFFNKRRTKALADARRYLLEDMDILKAYNSTEQFPEWIPHLTMGYPETPAKPDNRDYPVTHSVSFDRIALWTGDSQGIEFPLKEDDGGKMYMSAMGARFLEHYGVKGMKWGVTRADGGTGSAVKGAAKQVKTKVVAAYKPSRDAIEAQRFMARAKLGGVRNLDNREMQRVINRMQLERQYKELYGERQWHTKGKKWAQNFLTDVLKDAASSWLRNPFAKKSGQNPIRVQTWVNGESFANTLGDSSGRTRAIGR